MAEVEKPSPAADEALVKVLAVSVNPADWRSMRAKPFFSRATLGLLRPKHRIPGVDVAGRAEALGSGVTRFKPEDEVYANLLDHGSSGFAEYVSVPVEVMALKPADLSFEEAAAVPMAGVAALQGLLHHGEIQPGQGVLINGASGGVFTSRPSRGTGRNGHRQRPSRDSEYRPSSEPAAGGRGLSQEGSR
jgi:NADPH:quinone reductase-like Zn-dependent oxidoreductase